MRRDTSYFPVAHLVQRRQKWLRRFGFVRSRFVCFFSGLAGEPAQGQENDRQYDTQRAHFTDLHQRKIKTVEESLNVKKLKKDAKKADAYADHPLPPSSHYCTNASHFPQTKQPACAVRDEEGVLLRRRHGIARRVGC